MAFYSVGFYSDVEKDLRIIPKKDRLRIWHKIQSLAANPTPPGSLSLKGEHELARIRQGDYRIVYKIDHHAKQVIVIRVRHRRDVYL
jgi:mRNA interferase RelE/StbE